MLGLELREEFKGRRLKGTAIELTNNNKTGATQVPAADFLKITYPTADVLKTIEAIGPSQGRPITLRGERGQGKSHLMAMIYHAFSDTKATSSWLTGWAERLGNAKIGSIPLRDTMFVISESLHRQRYKYLWDLLFDQHPHGSYCKGKWESSGTQKTDVPSDEILLEMFKHTPTVLILDEFQTWYDGLTNAKKSPLQNWAFNFIQILSEIATEHPELLVLVVSVRNGNSDAFQQIQRVNPVIVDFKGPSAKQDRLRLLLHRLFENRIQVSDIKIETIISAHVAEYIRLKDIAPAEQQRVREEFIHAWPYAPHLMDLLEDQVLMATQAQETRDLIRILADLFKNRGDAVPVITAADFRLEDETSGITALLDSVANQHHAKLREKALRNLEAVRAAIANTNQKAPHLEGVIDALWLRSLAESNLAGADIVTLQLDVTREKPVDDNQFQVEMATITENSFNIHEDGNRYIFKEEENPQAKLIASARNDKQFQDGEDLAHLAKEVRYVIGGTTEVANKFRVIVLPQFWNSNPWEKLEESERPNQWDDRIPIVVLPESPDALESKLGMWLRDHLQANRNTVRFLIPRDGSRNLFSDRDLVVLARAVFLAESWKKQNLEYGKLQTKYQKELREIIKTRFDRFALISNWNFQEPKNCRFYIESHKEEGAKIPDAIHTRVVENLFVPEDFEGIILAAAVNNDSVGKTLKELREPRPGGKDCIPWLGETHVKERIIRLCASGKIAINLRGMEYIQRRDGEDSEDAWKRMRGKLGTGKHLDETYIITPQAVPAASGVAPKPSVQEPPADPIYVQTTGLQPSPEQGQETHAGPPGLTLPVVNPGSQIDIFSGSSDDVTITSLNSPATSALNLLGKVESWGIGPGAQLRSVSVKVDHLTGSQLQDLIKKLPDGMKYELNVDKEVL